MLGIHFLDEAPFETVYLHGLVRAETGAKMSKTVGNVVDPLEAIDEIGADALRFALIHGITPGNDQRLSRDKLENARNFGNKLWNAARYVLGARPASIPAGAPRQAPDPARLGPADRWLRSRIAATVASVDEAMDAFALGDATRQLYETTWSEFCDWGLELAKVRLGDEGLSAAEREATWWTLVEALDTLLRLLHPFLPFLTEAIWAATPHDAADPELLIVADWPDPARWAAVRDPATEAAVDRLRDLVTEVRNARSTARIAPGERRPGDVLVPAELVPTFDALAPAIERLARLQPLIRHADRTAFDGSERPGSLAVIAGDLEARIGADPGDVGAGAAERQRLERELADAERHLAAAEARLANAAFTARAPADVVVRRPRPGDGARRAGRPSSRAARPVGSVTRPPDDRLEAPGAPGPTVPGAGPARQAALDVGNAPPGATDDWWRTGVVYQIYPRSFADPTATASATWPGSSTISTTSRRRLRTVGVDAIWLSPIYPSPGLDVGYDVSDYAGSRSAVRHPGRLRTAGRRGPSARSPGHPRPRPQPHQPASTPGSSVTRASRTGPSGRLVHLARPGRADPDRPAIRPNNWRLVLRRPGLDLGRDPRQFYLHTFLPEQPDVELAQPGRPRGAARRHPDLARSRRRRSPVRRVQRLLQARRAAVQPAPARRPTGLLAGSDHLYDKDQPELVDAPRRDPRPRRRAARPDDRRRAVRALRRAGGRLRRSAPSRVRLRAGRDAAGRPVGFARSIAAARGRPSGPAAGRRSSCRTTIGRATPAATTTGATATPGPRSRQRSLLTLRGTPFLYYGEEIALRDVAVPRHEIVDPPARRATFLLSHGGTATRRGRRCPGSPAPTAASRRPSGRGCGWPPTSPPATSRPRRPTRTRVLSHYRRLLRLRRSLAALRDGSYLAVDWSGATCWRTCARRTGEAAHRRARVRRTEPPGGPAAEPVGPAVDGVLSTHPEAGGPDAEGDASSARSRR